MIKSRRLRPAVVLAALVTLVFAASLVPILALSRYARPYSDDFSFGWPYRVLLREGGNPLFSALRAAVSNAVAYYKSWQGSFSTILAGAVNPGIVNPRLYFLTTVLMLLALIAPTVLLCRRVFGAKGAELPLLAAPMLWLTIQYLPSVREGLFWYNGAVIYTFFYGVTVLWAWLMLRLLSGERAKVGGAILCAVLAFFLGGSNYVSALLTVLLGLCALIYCAAGKKRRHIPAAAVIFAVSALALILSAVAPGNAVRAAANGQMPPLMAVGYAFLRAGADCLQWTDWKIVLILLALCPLFIKLADRSACRFRFPLLVVLLSFCLFAAQNAPSFYALSVSGPGRLRDIVHDSYIWLMFGDAFYVLGWLTKRFRLPERVKLPKVAPGLFVTACLALFAAMFLFTDRSDMTAAQCLRDLQSGAAQNYAAEMDARFAYLQASGFVDVTLSPAASLTTDVPGTLAEEDGWGELGGDPDNWINAAMAEYFGNKSIVVK